MICECGNNIEIIDGVAMVLMPLPDNDDGEYIPHKDMCPLANVSHEIDEQINDYEYQMYER